MTTECRNCGHTVEPGLLICSSCGANPWVGGPLPHTVTRPAHAEPDVVCTECGTTNPARDRQFCARCLAPIRSGRANPPGPARLVFDIGIELSLEPGTEIVLGRDPLRSPIGLPLGQYDTVSRVHATVGSDPDGGSWVRDERSTNRTFVNNRPVPPSETVPLRPGDELRLASTVIAHLRAG